MDCLARKIIEEDTDLQESCSLLWQIQSNKPEIKQIYGHFLPPYHKKMVSNGLIAKDFNFPPSYGGDDGLYQLQNLYVMSEMLKPSTIVSISNSVIIRAEEDGAVIYTPHFNGYYVNNNAYEILKCCQERISIGDILGRLSFDLETTMEFLNRVLALDILDVHTP